MPGNQTATTTSATVATAATCQNASSETLQMVSLLCNQVLTPLLCLFGCVGNAFIVRLNVISARRQHRRRAVSTCLQALACWDSAFLCAALCVFTLPLHSAFMTSMMPHLYGLMHLFRTVSMWMSALISLERFMSVWFPPQHKVAYKQNRITYAILLIYLVAVLFSIPKFFEVRMQSTTFCDNSTQLQPVATELRQNQLYRKVYIFALQFVLIFSVPFLTVLILNCFIYAAIRQTLQLRRRSNNSKDGDSKTDPKKDRISTELSITLMLLVEAAVFVLCNTLPLMLNIIESQHVPWFRQELALYVTQLSNQLGLLNSASNFPVFCVFGHSFRREFTQQLLKCTPPRRPDSYG